MIESIHAQAERFGIERPELERYQYDDGKVIVDALTPESEAKWSNYLRQIHLAKLALNAIDFEN